VIEKVKCCWRVIEPSLYWAMIAVVGALFAVIVFYIFQICEVLKCLNPHS
jgi:hypothetical protein